MILARLIPKGSQKYQIMKNNIEVYADLLEKYNIINLFAVWTMTVSGITYRLGYVDRYSYWDWSGYMDGTIRLVLATTLFYITSKVLAHHVARLLCKNMVIATEQYT